MRPVCSLRQFALRLGVTLALSLGVAAAVNPALAQSEAQELPFSSDRISVEVVGQGPDVILLHGYASTKEVWRPVAERLSATHRVHLVQMSGFAGTPWVHGDSPFFQPMLDEVARYADGLERPAFIGHSMGGLSGIMLASQDPNRFSKVMSVDSLPFFGAIMDASATVETMRPMAQQMRSIIRSAPAFMYRAQQQQTAVTMTLREERRAEIVEASDSSDRQALANGIAELLLTDIRPLLPSITTPVWAVYAVDHAGPAPLAPTLWAHEYATLPDVKLEPVEGSRHFIMFDQPERLNALIDRFLAD